MLMIQLGSNSIVNLLGYIFGCLQCKNNDDIHMNS